MYIVVPYGIWIVKDILKRAYLCQVSDTGSPEPLVICKVSLTKIYNFSRKSLSNYLMDTLDFNEHDINIFINEMWQKYVGDYSKLQDVFFAWIAM
jgi:hypothetical protein